MNHRHKHIILAKFTRVAEGPRVFFFPFKAYFNLFYYTLKDIIKKNILSHLHLFCGLWYLANVHTIHLDVSLLSVYCFKYCCCFEHHNTLFFSLIGYFIILISYINILHVINKYNLISLFFVLEWIIVI